MNKSEKIKLGISIGDFNGIGIEVILKTFLDKRMLDFCTPIIFGSTKLISAYKKSININTPFNGVKSADKALSGKINIFNVWSEDVNLDLGNSSEDSGKYAFLSLEAATNALVENEIDVLVIDDVSTTGATLNSCAEALKKSGAREVYALSLARALPRHGLKTV